MKKVLFITKYRDAISTIVIEFDNKEAANAAIKAAKENIEKQDLDTTLECVRLY